MLGDRIKTLRTARNLSQVELARKLNVSKQSVSNWENNNILPSVDIVKKLALFFSCSTDYLLEMEQDRIMVEFTEMCIRDRCISIPLNLNCYRIFSCLRDLWAAFCPVSISQLVCHMVEMCIRDSSTSAL